MFWENVKKFLSFTGISEVTVWQDVAISAILIPVVLIVVNWLLDYWRSTRPPRSLLSGFLDERIPILVFHSQMSGADDNWNFNPDQKYITRYPDPLPSNSAHLGVQKKLRIDPILSQAEVDCLADIYNILGRCGRVENTVSADLINDWNKWSNPMFSVGFNPKTMKLIEKCEPMYFELLSNTSKGGMEIRDIGQKVSYDSFLPNDAGVIQKTYVKGERTPVFIMAGIGTAGTSACGFVLSKHLAELGKLYGDSPFCVFLRVTTNEGRESAYIDRICPRPAWFRVVLHLLTYYRFERNHLFI